MNPNNHSLSLAVKDIHTSIKFYKMLGFEPVEGTGPVENNWIIMRKGHSHIGLFQDMFEENIITFNPEDARTIYKDLKSKGAIFLMESDTINDPKGPLPFLYRRSRWEPDSV